MSDTPTHCPACNAAFDGGPIPEKWHEHYSPPYRFSRVISVYDMDRDRHDHWMCPGCGHEWPVGRVPKQEKSNA